jgi:predicted O-methyltransferase YrrM
MDHQETRRRYQVAKSLVSDEQFILPRNLESINVINCSVVADRLEMLKRFAKGGVVAELGCLRGEFAKCILSIVQPDQLHLFDLSFHQEQTPFDHGFFKPSIDNGQTVLHEGDSSTLLSEFPDEYFDWIYIDGDHSFEGVSKDLEQAKRKIKRDGILAFNDYTIYSPFEKMQYGVQRAVNDLILDEGFEIVIYALSICGYPDVCLKKIPKT